MNYDKKFRILPWPRVFRYSLIIILVFQTFVNGDNAQTANVGTDGNEKHVFDINFGSKKKYAIDDCIPLAFGDFNADKNVDIFCRSTKGKDENNFFFLIISFLGDSIRVMLNDDRSPTTKEIYRVNITGIIYDALAADFDGDSKLDLFILYKTSYEQIAYRGGIFWGNRANLSKQ